jgi:hypothetical protein
MTSIRRLALVSALSGAPVFAAPFLAIGDNAELFLTTNTQVRYEDNVGLAQDADKQDDLVYQVSPGFELSYGKKGDFKSTLAIFDQFVRYTNSDNLNSELLNVVWDASYKLAKLSVSADASYRQLVQNSPDIVNEVLEVVDSRRNVLSGSTTSEYAFTEKTKASTGISYSKTAYDELKFADSEIYTIPVNYFYGISPKVDLSTGLRYSETKVDPVNKDSKDSQDLNFNVGARGEYTAKLQGSFDIGYTVRTREGESEQGIIAVNSGLTYIYSLKSDFSLNAQSGFDTTPVGKSQRSYGVNLGGRTRFNDAYGASAGLGYKLTDGVTQDQLVTLDLGFRHTISDRVSLSADYRYQNNMSSVSSGAFAANTISFSANFRY